MRPPFLFVAIHQCHPCRWRCWCRTVPYATLKTSLNSRLAFTFCNLNLRKPFSRVCNYLLPGGRLHGAPLRRPTPCRNRTYLLHPIFNICLPFQKSVFKCCFFGDTEVPFLTLSNIPYHEGNWYFGCRIGLLPQGAHF